MMINTGDNWHPGTNSSSFLHPIALALESMMPMASQLPQALGTALEDLTVTSRIQYLHQINGRK
jgi:hypothetical protein